MVTVPQVLPISLEQPIKLISGGGGHVLICTESNRIFACGWNNKGQLGLGDSQDRSKFEEVSLDLQTDEAVLQMSCGWDSSAILTSSNRLFVCGGNSFNQIGMEDTKENVLRPQQLVLPEGAKALAVQLSMRQIVIRTADRIYISGRSQVWKDLEQENSKTPFRCYQPDERALDISAGQHHLLYTTAEHRVIGLGQNKFHQSEDQRFPHQKIVQIRSGWTHNACLLDTGDAYLWGRNTYGQLGSGKVTNSEPAPMKLIIPNQVADIQLGSEHGVARDVEGNIWTWGWNEHGNCGNGSEENVLKPQRIPFQKPAILCSCGAGFCYVVLKGMDTIEN